MRVSKVDSGSLQLLFQVEIMHLLLKILHLFAASRGRLRWRQGISIRSHHVLYHTA